MKTLATLDTISRWEKEINNLGGYTESWGLISVSNESPATISVSNNVAKGIFALAAGGFSSVAVEDNLLSIPPAQTVSAALTIPEMRTLIHLRSMAAWRLSLWRKRN